MRPGPCLVAHGSAQTDSGSGHIKNLSTSRRKTPWSRQTLLLAFLCRYFQYSYFSPFYWLFPASAAQVGRSALLPMCSLAETVISVIAIYGGSQS